MAEANNALQLGGLAVGPGASHSNGASPRGFGMIEMIGVLAILGLVAAIVLPNLARRIRHSNGEKEDQTLAVLGEGLQRYVRTYQSIPGQNSWTTNLAAMTGLALNAVKYVNPGDTTSARVYLIHPSFTPSTAAAGGFADPLWTQTWRGSSSVTNARIMILSTHKSGLALPLGSGKASSPGAFEAIWDWPAEPATGAPPAGWPSAWTGHGEYLHVQRIDLTAQFQHVTFSNGQYPSVYPAVQFGSAGSTELAFAANLDAFYLSGTHVRLYKDAAAGGTLDLSRNMERRMTFLYESNRWRIP